MNCSNCQNPIADGEKFCGKCGKTVDKVSNSQKGMKWASVISLLANFFLALPLSVPSALMGVMFTDSGASYGVVLSKIFLVWPLVALILFIVALMIFQEKNYKKSLVVSLIGNIQLLFLVIW